MYKFKITAPDSHSISSEKWSRPHFISRSVYFILLNRRSINHSIDIYFIRFALKLKKRHEIATWQTHHRSPPSQGYFNALRQIAPGILYTSCFLVYNLRDFSKTLIFVICSSQRRVLCDRINMQQPNMLGVVECLIRKQYTSLFNVISTYFVY